MKKFDKWHSNEKILFRCCGCNIAPGATHVDPDIACFGCPIDQVCVYNPDNSPTIQYYCVRTTTSDSQLSFSLNLLHFIVILFVLI
jgi:hypothetical protein